MSLVKEIELQQMGHLRNVSQKISQFLSKRLTGYLNTLTPLFAPRKVLGEFMDSAFKEKVPGADKNFAELEEQFKAITREAFNMPSKLGTPLPNIKNQLEVVPWEYVYDIGGDASQRITITSPVRWVLGYAGGYTLGDLLHQQVQGEKPQPEDIRQLILRSLTIAKLMELSPAVATLLEDLRFPLTVEQSSVSGALPHLVIGSALPSFRPQDELILTVTQLSGKPVFEELIDVEQLEALEDPFRSRVVELMG